MSRDRVTAMPSLLLELTSKFELAAAGIGCVLGLAAGLFQALTFAVVARALGSPGTAQPASFVWPAIAFLVATCLSQVLVARLTSRTAVTFRVAMLERCMRMPLETAELVERDGLMTLMLDYVRWVAVGVICFGVMFSRIGVLVVGIAIIARWSGLLAICTAAGLAGVLAVYVLSRSVWFRPAAASAENRHEDVVAIAREGVRRVKELKLSAARYEAFRARFAAALTRQRAGWWLTGYDALVEGILFVVLLVPPVVAVHHADTWHIDGSVLAAYAMMSLALLGPLGNIPKLVENISGARWSLEELRKKVFDVAGTLELEPADGVALPAWSKLVLDGVAFTYHTEVVDPFRLGPLSLEIQRGTIVFVTSGNGSGKSTLAKVIAGLYLPDEGTIRLDETAVEARNLDGYRSQFSAVFSDLYLPETLEGVAEAGDAERIATYLRELQLDDKVTITGGRISTTKLSDGQRKRLALLVAYLEDRPVYIFDEWASDQDPEFRRVFYTKLLPELKQLGKTIVAVTHDERYFSVADRILRLDRGRISA